MKSILTGKKASKKAAYPFLGIASCGNTVLFESDSCGTVVHDPDGTYQPGHHSEDWLMGDFELLLGKVTLSN